MQSIFHVYLDKLIIVFINNILIYSLTWKLYEEHLRIALQTLRDHCIFGKLSKCEFWLSEVNFLGHIISKDGVSINSSKFKAIVDWQSPKSMFEFHSFLGVVGYNYRFVKNFFSIVFPVRVLKSFGVMSVNKSFKF